jgi:hypothetical protein
MAHQDKSLAYTVCHTIYRKEVQFVMSSDSDVGVNFADMSNYHYHQNVWMFPLVQPFTNHNITIESLMSHALLFRYEMVAPINLQI